ncbi:MAG: hypothetical protein MUC31_03045, partial [Bacteroidales bacterium]|nr:hypothetical protein [Bacteroidales bacterium]
MPGITKNKSISKDLYLKIMMFIATVILLVMVLPKEGKFRYEFTKGKPWLHDDLYAPFDFAIIKYEDELKAEQENVLANLKPFFIFDTSVSRSQKVLFELDFEKRWVEKYGSQNAFAAQKDVLLRQGLTGLLDLPQKWVRRTGGRTERKSVPAKAKKNAGGFNLREFRIWADGPFMKEIKA